VFRELPLEMEGKVRVFAKDLQRSREEDRSLCMSDGGRTPAHWTEEAM
jgi:hypothetical protein